MNGDPDPAPIQRIPSQPFMEQKPQVRSPDHTHFRPAELSIEWVCHQNRKGGLAQKEAIGGTSFYHAICPESRSSNISKDMWILVLSLWMLVSWKREHSKLGRSRCPQWKQPYQEPQTSWKLQLLWLQAPWRLFIICSEEHLYPSAVESVANTSIPEQWQA